MQFLRKEIAVQHQHLAVLQILQSVPLRSWANQMAYYDKEKLATEDAMRIGRLHTFLPGGVHPGCARLHTQYFFSGWSSST